MDTIICISCGQELPATSEFFCVDKRNKSGLYRCCKKCNNLKKVENYPLVKAKKDAYRLSNRDKINEQKRNHYLENKEKINNANKKWYEENKDRAKAIMKSYRQTHKEQHNASSRERYQRIKDHHAVITRRWKQEHKDERNVHWQNRRAMLAGVKSDLTSKQWKAIKLHFENKCAYCGQELKLTQDHFIPIISGGEHTASNIIPACVSCNCSKFTKSFEEWYPTYKFYSKERYDKIKNFINKTT